MLRSRKDTPSGELPLPPSSEPQPYSMSRMLLGPVRLRIAIPALLVCVPVLFGAGVYSIIDLQIEAQQSADVVDELQQVRAKLIAFVIFACFFALTIGFAMVYYLVSPLERLRGSIERMSRGDFTRRLDLGQARDEIGRMGQSFDQMIEALNDVFSARNRLIFDNRLQSVLLVNLRGDIVSANPGAANLLGVEAGELVGQNLFATLAETPGNDPLARALHDALFGLSGQLASKQHLLVNRREEAKLVVVSTSPLETRPRRRSGIAITFQNLAGLREFYERINRSDRLAAVGTLAMGMAHEIRNPLGSIKGLVQILAQSAAAGSDTERYAEVIIKEVNRLNKLLTELLEFSHPSELSVEPTDLPALLASIESGARARVEEATGRAIPPATLETAGAGTLNLPADKARQALFNIILNAHEAAAEANGEVRVRAQARDGGAFIEIENTGSTIPEENLERVFQPFFTTKEKGTGLGLALSYQILTYMGAQIDARSDDDSVCFAIDLPSARLAPAASPDDSTPMPMPMPGGGFEDDARDSNPFASDPTATWPGPDA